MEHRVIRARIGLGKTADLLVAIEPRPTGILGQGRRAAQAHVKVRVAGSTGNPNQEIGRALRYMQVEMPLTVHGAVQVEHHAAVYQGLCRKGEYGAHIPVLGHDHAARGRLFAATVAPQPLNAEFAAAVAVRLTMLPSLKLAAQTLPQAIPAGLLVTVPEPEPARSTPSLCCCPGATPVAASRFSRGVVTSLRGSVIGVPVSCSRWRIWSTVQAGCLRDGLARAASERTNAA